MSDERNRIFVFQDGGSMSLHSVFKLYYRSLCYFSAHIVNDNHQAEDIVAELFARICRKKVQFRTIGELRSFLYTGVKNASIDCLRREKRTRNIIKDLSQFTPETETAFDREMIMAQVLQSIYAELESLPSQCQKVFRGIFLEGKNVNTLASEMELSPQTVLNHKSRAIKLIRFALMKNDPLTYSLFVCVLLEIAS